MNRLHERRRQVVFFSNSGPLDAMLSPEPHRLDGVALPRHRRDDVDFHAATDDALRVEVRQR